MTAKQLLWAAVLLITLVAGWCLVGAIADGPASKAMTPAVSHSEPRSRLIGTSG